MQILKVPSTFGHRAMGAAPIINGGPRREGTGDQIVPGFAILFLNAIARSLFDSKNLIGPAIRICWHVHFNAMIFSDLTAEINQWRLPLEEKLVKKDMIFYFYY